MKYFLDFDRTLFDTDAFNASLPDEPGCAAFKEDLKRVLAQGRDDTLAPPTERAIVWERMTQALKSGELSFAPGYLQRFVYPDVTAFLTNIGDDAIIVTYGEETRQRAKVESALAHLTSVPVLYTGELGKAEFLASWPGYTGDAAVFIDDRTPELVALSERFPELTLYRMQRKGARTTTPEQEQETRWTDIQSLVELS